LNLSHNNVNTEGALALQGGILQSKVLEKLDLEGCNMDEEAVQLLMEAIQSCPGHPVAFGTQKHRLNFSISQYLSPPLCWFVANFLISIAACYQTIQFPGAFT